MIEINDLSKLVSSIGLALDIIGAILIFIYGIPSRFIDPRYKRIKKPFPWDSDEVKYTHDTVQGHTKTHNKKYKFWSNFGIVLLLIGFILQLLSNFI